MTKLYKLTDSNGQTRGKTQWGPGVTHEATGDASQPLCSDGWIHAYTHPLLAVLLNPIHGDFTKPQLWEATGKVGKEDHGLKVGCRSLTTVKRIALPKVTRTQQVAFGILCTLKVYKDKGFRKWAKNWLNGKDRTSEAANAAYAAAYVAYAADAAYAYADAAANADIPLIKLAKRAMKY